MIYKVAGQNITIGHSLGRGGEGEVFSINELPDQAFKAYHDSVRDDREPKVRAMLEAKLATAASTIAFPSAEVRDSTGKFAGFTMRRAADHHPIHELYAPASRKKHFPEASYRFLVKTAMNIAKAVASSHKLGCLIGDINHSGILISDQATAMLIDADSFQFIPDDRQFLCLVGVPEYTPPELQGKSLSKTVRTQEHDAFGLAVVIFQLLFMGRHPFSGTTELFEDISIERAITENRFAYSKVRDTGMAAPPGACGLSDFPDYIAEAFETAFAPIGPKGRPKPKDWIALIEMLEISLRPCTINALHHYPRAAKDCPWCRMEAVFGTPMFLGKPWIPNKIGTGQSGISRPDIDRLATALKDIPIPTSILAPPVGFASGLPPSYEAVEIAERANANTKKKVGAAAAVLAGLFVLVQGLWMIAPAFGLLALGLWWRIKPENRTALILRRGEDTRQRLKERIEEMQASRLQPIIRMLEKRAEILEDIEELKQLSLQYSQVRSDYEEQRRQIQLDKYLDNKFIQSGRIEGLSTTDKSALASFGIETALDLRRRNLRQVFGVGPIKEKAITSWVLALEKDFQYQVAYTQTDIDEIRRRHGDIFSRQQTLMAQINPASHSLKREVATVAALTRDKLDLDDNVLRETLDEFAQLRSDILYLKLGDLPLPIIVPFAVPFDDTLYGDARRALASDTATARKRLH
jgi:DNA-binding helix-hairpin-helix protein with protein kinase domain